MMKKALFFILVLLALCGLSAGAADLTAPEMPAEQEEQLSLTFGFFGNYLYTYEMVTGQGEQNNLYDTSQLKLEYTTPLFDIVIDGMMSNDEKYDGADEQEYLYGRYLFLDAGYTDLRLGPFTVRAGRSSYSDEVEIPYSVFISSEKHPSLMADVRYEGDLFFYESRWISLNSDSSQYYTGYNPGEPLAAAGTPTHWADRGMNYKVYGINAGDWRFGFQDSVIYLNREFDPEYFFNPAPMYFIQIITTAPGRPYGEFGDAKSLMGFFVEREREGDYGAAQILIDDLNGSFIPGVEVGNLTKMSWSLGGRKETLFGTFGFYHAGATKYTFQGTYADDDQGEFELDPPEDSVDVYYNYYPYEYTYYPVSVYMLESGDPMPLHYTDNYIGYKYGENNLAFMVDYENSFRNSPIGRFDLYSSLEWILSGAKAPSNPWHEGYNTDVSDKSFELLDGTVEHVIVNTTRFSKPVGGFMLNLDLVLGYRFNAMKLEQAPTEPDAAYIFYPQSGEHEPIVELRIGGSYTWDM